MRFGNHRPFTAVRMSTDISTDFGSLNYTVNGAGLPGNTPSLTGTHAARNFSNNAWLGNYSLGGNITFNLNGSYSLAGFSFWNLSGQGNSADYGIKGVTVQASTDGTTFTTISGAPTEFSKGTGGSVGPQQYSFSPVTAS